MGREAQCVALAASRLGLTPLGRVAGAFDRRKLRLAALDDLVADPLAFNQMILKARLAQYEKAITCKESIVFFDRGIPDVLAYMDCFDQVYGAEFEDAARSNPYDLIFLMPPWREIHVVDNERFESFEESLLVNTCLLNRYTALGYDVQVVPKNTVADRVDFILDFLNQTT